MAKSTKYPVGDQSFPSLIEEGYLYVDKTRFIGYLTIQSYNRKYKIYIIGLPNAEVKEGLLNNLQQLRQKIIQ